MSAATLKAILILPGTALVYVPALLLWLSRGTEYAARLPPGVLAAAAGLILAGAGLVLMGWTMRLFAASGGGSPAPWDPIRTFVVAGPYRYVRNPMLIGVILFLFAEAVLLVSLPILGWAVFFFLLNTAYFAYREESELVARYGADYEDYKRQVPRWVPRLTPYDPAGR